jgi:hypothetical protein
MCNFTEENIMISHAHDGDRRRRRFVRDANNARPRRHDMYNIYHRYYCRRIARHDGRTCVCVCIGDDDHDRDTRVCRPRGCAEYLYMCVGIYRRRRVREKGHVCVRVGKTYIYIYAYLYITPM